MVRRPPPAIHHPPAPSMKSTNSPPIWAAWASSTPPKRINDIRRHHAQQRPHEQQRVECTRMIHAATKMGVPRYFFSSSAGRPTSSDRCLAPRRCEAPGISGARGVLVEPQRWRSADKGTRRAGVDPGPRCLALTKKCKAPHARAHLIVAAQRQLRQGCDAQGCWYHARVGRRYRRPGLVLWGRYDRKLTNP